MTAAPRGGEGSRCRLRKQAASKEGCDQPEGTGDGVRVDGADLAFPPTLILPFDVCNMYGILFLSF